MAADTPAVRFGQETHLHVYLPITRILKEPEFADNIQGLNGNPKGIPEKCTKNGNKDFTIDLTSKKSNYSVSLLPLELKWYFLDFMIHLLNSLAALVGGYSIH